MLLRPARSFVQEPCSHLEVSLASHEGREGVHPPPGRSSCSVRRAGFEPAKPKRLIYSQIPLSAWITTRVRLFRGMPFPAAVCLKQ